MDTYSFQFLLADDRGMADDLEGEVLCDLANELYEAGCDDGSPGVFCGQLEVTFDREAETMRDAIYSALEHPPSNRWRASAAAC